MRKSKEYDWEITYISPMLGLKEYLSSSSLGYSVIGVSEEQLQRAMKIGIKDLVGDIILPSAFIKLRKINDEE